MQNSKGGNYLQHQHQGSMSLELGLELLILIQEALFQHSFFGCYRQPQNLFFLENYELFLIVKLYMRPMAVTRVCADYDSYLKIGPNQKKRSLDCQARQALFALWMTTIFEISVFQTPPYQKRASFEHYDIACKHKSKQTHKPQKMQ